MKFEWDYIFCFQDHVIMRAKIKGGWLVMQTTKFEVPRQITTAMTFVPDENHEWEIEKE